MTEDNQDFYLLGYWVNPYQAKDREYFWCGPFESQQEALGVGKSKQKHGQPKRFRDWMAGVNKVFSSQETFVAAANKVGMKPRLDY